MLDQKEEDQRQIAELRQKMSTTGGDALNRLHEMVIKQEARGAGAGSGYSQKYDRKTREELMESLDQKDHLIEELRTSMAGLAKEKELLIQKRNGLSNQVAALEQEL